MLSVHTTDEPTTSNERRLQKNNKASNVFLIWKDRTGYGKGVDALRRN